MRNQDFLKKLDDLKKQISCCTKCKLAQTRTYAIPGEGALDSTVMLVAQSPGKVEDERNKMFVGPSGKIFNELLEHAGIDRQEIYITNLIKCMLPNSRRPSQDEIKQCTWYLDKEIVMIQPKLIVPLGFHATRYIFTKYNIPRPQKNEYHTLFGKIVIADNIKIHPVRHPTALLFNPDKKKVMEKNYKALKYLSDSL